MSSNDRPTEKELAQTFFADLIRDPNTQPDSALNPETARLIRDLVLAEQAAAPAKGADFATVRQRIRQNVQLPLDGKIEVVETGGIRRTGPVIHETSLAGLQRPGGLAWNKFLALAGMAATIVLVIGILVLSLAAVRPPDATPNTGASPVSIPTVQVQPTPTPTPTVQPTANSKPATNDLLNPKAFLPQAQVDVAKTLSLDYNAMLKQLQSGLSLAEIATNQNVTLDSLKAIMLDSFKAQIDADKSSGLLTQAQSDQLYKASSAFIDDYVVSQNGPTDVKVIPTPDKKG